MLDEERRSERGAVVARGRLHEDLLELRRRAQLAVGDRVERHAPREAQAARPRAALQQPAARWSTTSSVTACRPAATSW